MTSVLIIDDHPRILQGCWRLLEDARIEPIFTASDLMAGYEIFQQHHPDVVIVKLAWADQGLGGLELIRRIRAHDGGRARILVLSMHNDPMIVARSLESGASGYVLMDTGSEELVRAVLSVSTGTPFICAALAMKVALRGSSAQSNLAVDLAPCQMIE